MRNKHVRKHATEEVSVTNHSRPALERDVITAAADGRIGVTPKYNPKRLFFARETAVLSSMLRLHRSRTLLEN